MSENGLTYFYVSSLVWQAQLVWSVVELDSDIHVTQILRASFASNSSGVVFLYL